MSWREDYQPGSFRGAAFRSRNHELSGGRRAIHHEFPGRDEPLAEDLGRRARLFRLECHVLGEDYFADRDALQDALEAEGPGLLIHPWKGAMQVQVFDFLYTENTEEGGVAWFSVTFGEAGEPASLDRGIDSQTNALAVADLVEAQTITDFAGQFSIDKLPMFVEDAAGQILDVQVEAVRFAAAIGGGVGPTLRTFEASLRFLPDSVQTLLRTPLALGQAVNGMVVALGLLDRPSRRKIASFEDIMTLADRAKPVPGATPARNQQRRNQTALYQLFDVSAAAGVVRAVAKVEFASYEEATDTRDRLSDLLDAKAIVAADAGRDRDAAAFDDLRRALVRDIGERGASLERVYAHRLDTTTPSLAIANRLYGHRGVAARAADIVARNAIPHPGFVPGGTAVQVLTDG